MAVPRTGQHTVSSGVESPGRMRLAMRSVRFLSRHASALDLRLPQAKCLSPGPLSQTGGVSGEG